MSSQETQIARERGRVNRNRDRKAQRHGELLHQRASTETLEEEVAMKNQNYLRQPEDIEMTTLEALEEHKHRIICEAVREINKQENEANDTVKNLQKKSCRCSTAEISSQSYDYEFSQHHRALLAAEIRDQSEQQIAKEWAPEQARACSFLQSRRPCFTRIRTRAESVCRVHSHVGHTAVATYCGPNVQDQKNNAQNSVKCSTPTGSSVLGEVAQLDQKNVALKFTSNASQPCHELEGWSCHQMGGPPTLPLLRLLLRPLPLLSLLIARDVSGGVLE